MTLEQFCAEMTDILERYNTNVRALIEEVCKTSSATSPSSPAPSLPASTPTSAIVDRIYKQADASAEPFEREL